MLTSADFFGSLQVGAETGFLGGILTVIIQFAFVAGLLIMSLTVSQSLGAYGASTVVNWGKKNKYRPAGFVGRHTLGRGANGILDSERVKKFAADNPRIASVLLRPVEATAKSKFGGTKSYQKALEDDAKRIQEIGKYATYNNRGEKIERITAEGEKITNEQVFQRSIGIGKTEAETKENIRKAWLPSRRKLLVAINKKNVEEKKKGTMKEKVTKQKEEADQNIKKARADLERINKEISEMESVINTRGNGAMTDLQKSQYTDKLNSRTIFEQKVERYKEKLADLEIKEAEGDRLKEIQDDINKKPEKEDKDDKGDKSDKK
jgi:hypothetical protein